MSGLLLGCAGGSAAESGGAAATGQGATATTGTGGTSEAPPTTGLTATGGGATEVDCLAPLERCEGVCVDVLHDPRHCGGCGLGCPEALVCIAGECGVACGPHGSAIDVKHFGIPRSASRPAYP